MNNGITHRPLLESGRMIASGETSSENLVADLLQRIHRYNPGLNCYLEVFADAALQQARLLDREIRDGRRRGPLHGVPVAVKDIFDFPGHHASGGSKLARTRGEAHATVMRKLEAAGAVLTGVLNLDELAAGGSGDNACFGRCRNPWNPQHNTGGSSGGSAAAVAAGLAGATLGSDAGGSIRIPAAFCGVVGLKPSYGRVSRHGALARTWSMDCIGPLALDCDDACALLNAIDGLDPLDASSVDSAPSSSDLDSLSRDSLPVIGYLDDPGCRRHQESDSNFAGAMKLFADAGYSLRAISTIDLERYTRMQQILVKSEGAAMHERALRNGDPLMSHAVRSVIEGGLAIPAVRYIEALSLRPMLLQQFIESAFAACDLLLMPVSLATAPSFAPTDALEADEIDRAFSQTATLTRFANYLGLPAIAIPSGLHDNGLPTAIQLVARPFAESLLLTVGADFERRRAPMPYADARLPIED